jgi:hypothetical protein
LKFFETFPRLSCSTRHETKPNPASLIQFKTTTPRFLVAIALLLACFALSPMAKAVDAPPGGGYAGGNTAEGDNALFSRTTGEFNTANGYEALYSNTEGNFNTANGADALFSNTTGNENTALGYEALESNGTGGDNTAIGYLALIFNTTGTNTSCGPACADPAFAARKAFGASAGWPAGCVPLGICPAAAGLTGCGLPFIWGFQESFSNRRHRRKQRF